MKSFLQPCEVDLPRHLVKEGSVMEMLKKLSKRGKASLSLHSPSVWDGGKPEAVCCSIVGNSIRTVGGGHRG